MSTHRTMLFDHCVITFPVHHDAGHGPGPNDCTAEPLLRRRDLLRTVLAGGLLVLLAMVLLSIIGVIVFGACSKGETRSQCERYVHGVSATTDLKFKSRVVLDHPRLTFLDQLANDGIRFLATRNDNPDVLSRRVVELGAKLGCVEL